LPYKLLEQATKWLWKVGLLEWFYYAIPENPPEVQKTHHSKAIKNVLAEEHQHH
jgi:hypothetical protein